MNKPNDPSKATSLVEQNYEMKRNFSNCCNHHREKYRKDYPANDGRAWAEVHARGCINHSAPNNIIWLTKGFKRRLK